MMNKKIFELEYKNILYVFVLSISYDFESLYIISSKINDNFNNYYLCKLSLYDINRKGGIFKECKSIKESLDLFVYLFSSKIFEIKNVEKYKNIIIGFKDNKSNIFLNEKKILFQLDYKLSFFQNIKNTINSTNKCQCCSFPSFLMNIKFFNTNHDDNEKYNKIYLSGLLNLCLLKYISNFFDNDIINKIKYETIKNIIIKLKNNIKFTGDIKEDIKLILEEKKGNNILAYSFYLNSIIKNDKIINYLINLFENEKKEKVDIIWRKLSKYDKYNSFFENEFKKDLKKTIFDYSLVSLNILERDDEEEYNMKKKECPNIEKKILYHGTQIKPISEILTNEFNYTRKAFYGMGIYFSSIIDYISFYTGGENYSNRRKNFGKITPINNAFSFIASEIFYDKKKFKQITDKSLLVPPLNHFPSYNELKNKYFDKMIEPNGIHFIKVDNNGEPITNKDAFDRIIKGEFIGNEYAITEKYQIFPIYSLTLKRNEFFILWRDQNFKEKNKFNEFLKIMKLFCYEKAIMNIYCEESTEEALKFLWRRKYNKVILITSIGEDLSGKRFVEVARKILGFNVIVLFFSANRKHLEWIQNFPNCLYTDSNIIYKEYITNFNEIGLKNLRKEVEKKYNIKLKPFSYDFLSYPKFINNEDFSNLNFSSINPYIKRVIIYCNKWYLGMTENGKVKRNSNPCYWDIIIINNEISLFSNGFYLSVEDKGENAIGFKYMKIWNFVIVNNYYYYFLFPEKKNNNILSVKNENIKVNSIAGENELFLLYDIIQEDN